MMKRNAILWFVAAVLLSACSSPISYLPAQSAPIVNIEAEVAEQVKVEADTAKLHLLNQSAQNVALQYQLWWYNAQGVTQTQQAEEQYGNINWQQLYLHAKAAQTILLTPPTGESVNYRVYIRQAR